MEIKQTEIKLIHRICTWYKRSMYSISAFSCVWHYLFTALWLPSSTQKTNYCPSVTATLSDYLPLHWAHFRLWACSISDKVTSELLDYLLQVEVEASRQPVSASISTDLVTPGNVRAGAS